MLTITNTTKSEPENMSNSLTPEETEANDSLKIWPWQNGEAPYFVDHAGPNGTIEWYLDKDLTRYARSKDRVSGKPLPAACFVTRKAGDPNPMERVLVGQDQTILHADTTLEGMACKIDFLRLVEETKK